MALTDILTSYISPYDATDATWKLFIIDHKDYLINLSNTATISGAYMQKYEYSLRKYLQSINYNVNCFWIVALINNIPTDMNFTSTINFLLIPPMPVIEELYTTYITLKTNSP